VKEGKKRSSSCDQIFAEYEIILEKIKESAGVSKTRRETNNFEAEQVLHLSLLRLRR